MSKSSLSRLTKVGLREVWASEPSGFTRWLAEEENLQLLGDAIGLDLELQAQEKNVGPFRADLLCKETEGGRSVVIENQIEDTDHKHFGQLLTYAAGLDAPIVIWIAQAFTEEHRAALDWLNENTKGSASFFGIEIEVWRIGDSARAPKFNIVSKPNDWANRVKQSVRTGALTTSEHLRVKYWTALAALLKATGSRLRPRDPVSSIWLRVQPPMPGFRCGFEVSSRGGYVEVFFGVKNNRERSELLRRIWQGQEAELKREVGDRTEGVDKEDSGTFWISSLMEGDPSDVKDWPRQHQWMKVTLENLIAALCRRIATADGIGLEG